MDKMEVRPIGRVEEGESGTRIVLDPAYGPALRGLEGYSHVQVVWWFDRAEDSDSLVERKSYAKGPEELGVLATRSPKRPDGTVIASHMDTVSHGHLSRDQLKRELTGARYAGRVLIPEDGERIEIA